MESLDTQTVGASGVLGAALMYLGQVAIARIWPRTTPSPAPITPPGPAPTLTPAVRPTLSSLLEAVAVELLRASIAGGEVSPAIKAAAPVLRRLLDEIDSRPQEVRHAGTEPQAR